MSNHHSASTSSTSSNGNPGTNSVSPRWLPPELKLHGARVEDDYSTLYAVFSAELMSGVLDIEGCPVTVDTSKDTHLTQYERGFTHLVTRDNGAGLRAIDYDRACRISWIKPVIENHKEPEVYAFWHMSPKGPALYLWLFDYDFVVILKPMRGSRSGKNIIVTAYSVDSHRRRDLQRRYGNATRILS